MWMCFWSKKQRFCYKIYGVTQYSVTDTLRHWKAPTQEIPGKETQRDHSFPGHVEEVDCIYHLVLQDLHTSKHNKICNNFQEK